MSARHPPRWLHLSRNKKLPFTDVLDLFAAHVFQVTQPQWSKHFAAVLFADATGAHAGSPVDMIEFGLCVFNESGSLEMCAEHRARCVAELLLEFFSSGNRASHDDFTGVANHIHKLLGSIGSEDARTLALLDLLVGDQAKWRSLYTMLASELMC